MPHPLAPLHFPLFGSALIEASAGTGKTWTIAALYLRLVLGHGEEAAFRRPLLPSEILVMTFTRAATRELSDRIRARLVEAARFFRGEIASEDRFLQALLACYPAGVEQARAAHRLMLAAESMDEAAIFTIDAWCQRMLREHAFDSASLFDESLLSNESQLYGEAVRDYWRQQVYPLEDRELGMLLAVWPDVSALEAQVRELVPRGEQLAEMKEDQLRDVLRGLDAHNLALLQTLKDGWHARADRMQRWINDQLERHPKCFNGNKIRSDRTATWFDALRAWADDPTQWRPDWNDTPWRRLTPEGMADACSKGVSLVIPDDFAATHQLAAGLAQLIEPGPLLLQHAASHIACRMQLLKSQSHEVGFKDLLLRLMSALEDRQGEALRQHILAQYPVALVDEFQDTAPAQFRIFDLLYQIAANDPQHGLFLIGDPKQSIYGFRGADIHSYLAAKRATQGRHYHLSRNYRSSKALVEAVNHLFTFAEGSSHSGGAFDFRRGDDAPLPFVAVEAQGLSESWRHSPPLTIWSYPAPDVNRETYLDVFAAQCAEQIVALLNDEDAGFDRDGHVQPLQAADIAVLVRDRNEAAAMRHALQSRGVASVYLSDQDSVFHSEEAADCMRWLQAMANPQDNMLARAALASRTVDLSLGELARLTSDDEAWEQRLEQWRQLHYIWQRQGILAAIRHFIHDLDLPARLLARQGGERSLTNVLHLAELLQAASQHLDGEQALLRWLATQISGAGDAGDERIVRLESEAALVKVVTIHKSKGLEYPLVFIPYGVSARAVSRKDRSFFEFTDAFGERRLDLTLSDEALAAMEQARRAEDIRLLYVALTRARHAVWLGVTALAVRRGSPDTRLHESAFGYLLTAGMPITAPDLPARLQQLNHQTDSIVIQPVHPINQLTKFKARQQPPALGEAANFQGEFERDWGVSSFSAITRALAPMAAPTSPLQEKLWQSTDSQHDAECAAAAWHRFPRGPLPGNFLHEQLEWLGQEGFTTVYDDHFAQRLADRCERAGWGHRSEDVVSWLHKIATTTLPPLGCALADLTCVLPEMEFWFPADHVSTRDMDLVCQNLLPARYPRPELPERTLHGMLKGYADLIFEHKGRYWVLDYKSNSLGRDDTAYHADALTASMAAHRYEVQGAIYLYALHRLLANRLGENYEPAKQLGGAIFLYLRGIAHPERGCHVIASDTDWLESLQALLATSYQDHSPIQGLA